MVVIRVDKDKGYIDLSKRKVSKEDIERKSKAKAVTASVRHVAEILGLKTIRSWRTCTRRLPGTRDQAKKQGTAYDSSSLWPTPPLDSLEH